MTTPQSQVELQTLYRTLFTHYCLCYKIPFLKYCVDLHWAMFYDSNDFFLPQYFFKHHPTFLSPWLCTSFNFASSFLLFQTSKCWMFPLPWWSLPVPWLHISTVHPGPNISFSIPCGPFQAPRSYPTPTQLAPCGWLMGISSVIYLKENWLLVP